MGVFRYSPGVVRRRAVPLTLICLVTSPLLIADDYRITSISFPGSTFTDARGINAREEIVGVYEDADGIGHGYLLRNGAFTTIDIPGAVSTGARKINARGDITGSYWDADGVAHTYVLSDDLFIPIDYPESIGTLAGGANDAGDVTGTWIDGDGNYRGFLFKDGGFFDVQVPGSVSTQVDAAQDNGRTLVGNAFMGDDDATRAFVRYGPDDFRLFDFPGLAVPCTGAIGINQRGDIVGGFAYANSAEECHRENMHGYVLSNGEFTQIDVPDSTATQAMGINDEGVIAGRYIDREGRTHGFKAVPID